MTKIKICVLFGGISPEHNISLMSAKNVINSLDKDKYDVYPVGITKTGKWFLYNGNLGRIPTGEWESDLDNKSVTLSCDRHHKGLIVLQNGKYEVVTCDLVFPVLHGTNCEDGNIQGLIHSCGLPVVGPELVPSCICMNKILTKIILKEYGISQANFIGINRLGLKNVTDINLKVESKFGYPVFVKPSASGSSLGAHIVHSTDELIPAIEDAFKYDDIVLIEEYIKGHDFECAIAEIDGQILASGIGEILSGNEFYDYNAKYTDGVSNVLTRSTLSSDKVLEIQEISKKAYQALYLNGFCRVDFMIEGGTGRILLNEINTIPGCTKYSLFPALFEGIGIKWPELLDKIIISTLKRWEIKDKTHR